MNCKTRRRTETTVETHEVWIVRRPSSSSTSPVWCPECTPQRAEMLSPEEAARRLRLNPRTIYRWVEAGQTHFRESEDGWLLICLASLPAPDAVVPSPPLLVVPTAPD